MCEIVTKGKKNRFSIKIIEYLYWHTVLQAGVAKTRNGMKNGKSYVHVILFTLRLC